MLKREEKKNIFSALLFHIEIVVLVKELNEIVSKFTHSVIANWTKHRRYK
jgi:hypothetical protein